MNLTLWKRMSEYVSSLQKVDDGQIYKPNQGDRIKLFSKWKTMLSFW